MEIILLETNVIPTISWYGIVLTSVITLLGFLLRDAYQRIQKRQDISDKALEDLTQKLESEKLNSEKAMRSLEARINDLHVNILDRLDEIKDKFSEFRK